MRTIIGCVAVLLCVMGTATEAAAVRENNASWAGKRGLSPIISRRGQAGRPSHNPIDDTNQIDLLSP